MQVALCQVCFLLTQWFSRLIVYRFTSPLTILPTRDLLPLLLKGCTRFPLLGLWTGRDLAVTRNIGVFLGLIRWTVPFKTSRRYWGPLLTRIPGLPGILTFWGRRFSNVNIAFSVIRSYLHSEIGMSPFIWTKVTSLFPWMFCANFCWICRGKRKNPDQILKGLAIFLTGQLFV